MKKFLIIVFFITLSLSSCQNQNDIIATAIMETQTSIAMNASPTPTIVPSKTPTPTREPLPTITPAPTKDIRTINDESKILLLSRDELNALADNLPVKPYYYIPDPSWSGPHTNSEVIGFNGQDKGNNFVLETGRIEGYYAMYYTDSNRTIAPKAISMYVETFDSIEGAKKVEFYNFHSDDDYYEIDREFNLDGVSYLTLYAYKEMLSSGKYAAAYEIYFIYRNVGVTIEGYDEQIETFTEEHFNFDFVELVASASLEKIKLAELY